MIKRSGPRIMCIQSHVAYFTDFKNCRANKTMGQWVWCSSGSSISYRIVKQVLTAACFPLMLTHQPEIIQFGSSNPRCSLQSWQLENKQTISVFVNWGNLIQKQNHCVTMKVETYEDISLVAFLYLQHLNSSDSFVWQFFKVILVEIGPDAMPGEINENLLDWSPNMAKKCRLRSDFTLRRRCLLKARLGSFIL